jgi:hypothetical protein
MNANLISEPGAFVENVTDNYSSVSPDMLQVRGLSPQQPEHKTRAVEPRQPFLVSAMSDVQKRELACIVAAWVVVTILFWRWWFEPRHIADVWRFGFNSAALTCGVMLPAYYLFFVDVTRTAANLEETLDHNSPRRCVPNTCTARFASSGGKYFCHPAIVKCHHSVRSP